MSSRRPHTRVQPAGVLLYPGAGSDRNQPSLIAIEHALAPLPVRRADFPYRIAGRKAPDRAPVLLAAVRAEAADFAAQLGVGAERLVYGGRSMGGRMCSIAVAGDPPVLTDSGVAPAVEPLAARALVLIAYPLHPPGRPETLRTEHFPRLTLPCLFISGTKDTFGTPAELQHWTATIPGPVTHIWMDGKGHDLKGCDQRIADIAREWLASL